MSESTNQLKTEKPPMRLWPYAFWGSFLLVVFVAGILAPDYFNYRIRLAKIEATSKISAATATTVPSANTTSSTTAATSPVSPAQGASTTVADNLALASTEVKSSEIFETYGKLLTMLLAFASVLGVFFGYFVRKSLREVEEDLRGYVQQSMDFWGNERDRLSSEVAGKLKEINEQGQQQAKLSQEFEKIIERGQKALQALEATAKAEEQKLTGDIGRTAAAAAEIDKDETIPNPPGK
jgi:hypothetical protein